jgi:Bacterial sugar transferase
MAAQSRRDWAVFLGDACGGGPVFFAYKRVGRNGITFRCLKFHTMVVGAEECLAEYLKYRLKAAEEWKTQGKLAFDRRITTLGAFLRKASLDELPQPGQAFGFANRGQAMTHRILCPNGVTGAVASGSLLVRNYPILSRGVPCTARSSEIARYR